MWWYKIPALLIVAITNHISLSNQKITHPRSRTLYRVLLLAFEVCPSGLSAHGCGGLRVTSGTLKAGFWTLTACEIALIWSVNHLRSPVAHRILVRLTDPSANFPPNPRISLPFAIGWCTSTFSLAIHIISNSYHQRVLRSSPSPHYVSTRRIQIAGLVVHGSNAVMAVGSVVCYIGPGSFASECWVWRKKFWGTFLCLMGVSYAVFWLVVIWRLVRSQHSLTVSEPMEGVASSDGGLGGNTEILVMDRVD